ncbi:MAG: aromatic ring-hydroxylating oxygenase subunit alpha [Pseudomonadales bacterium]
MPSPLLELINADALEKVAAPLEQAWTLPPNAYTDRNVFAAEAERIFAADWICVAREEQLPEPGDYVCVDLVRQPIVLTRSHADELHALSRVCLHRAMPIAAGTGNARRFVCPYHNWTYELDGRLRSAPMMSGATGFSIDQCQLPQLALEVWNGFVFVNLDNQAAPLHSQLTGLTKLVGNYDFSQLRIAQTLHFDSPWNWKILVENFMEAYHHIGIHRATFEPNFPARESSVPDNGGEPWAFLHMPGLQPETEEGSSFAALDAKQRADLFAAAVFPNFLFAATNNGGVWYQLEPHGSDAMSLRIHILLHPEIIAALSDDEMQHMAQVYQQIHSEDIEANSGPWLGLNAALTTQGRLSPFEKAIWQLNQYWLERMGARQ